MDYSGLMGISTLTQNMQNASNAMMMLNNANIKLQENELSMQMAQQKSEWNMWKMVEDTQNKIYEIQQTVAVDQAKTQDKMFNKWDEYIKS